MWYNNNTKERGDGIMIYKCQVFNKRIGWDEYLVSAKSEEEAWEKCRERLDEETDDPKNWEIVNVEVE
jgi:hypothetical protein